MTEPQFDVFLSYAREDSLVAEELSRRLRDAGLSIWHDRDSLAPGDNFHTATLSAIRNSRVFAVVISAASARSNSITAEVANALAANDAQGRPRIVPLRKEGFIEDFPFLRQFQYADISSPDKLSKTVSSLKELLAEETWRPLPSPGYLARYDDIAIGVARKIESLERDHMNRVILEQSNQLSSKLGSALATAIMAAGFSVLFFKIGEGTHAFISFVSVTAAATLANVFTSFLWERLSRPSQPEEAPRE